MVTFLVIFSLVSWGIVMNWVIVRKGFFATVVSFFATYFLAWLMFCYALEWVERTSALLAISFFSWLFVGGGGGARGSSSPSKSSIYSGSESSSSGSGVPSTSLSGTLGVDSSGNQRSAGSGCHFETSGSRLVEVDDSTGEVRGSY